MIRNIFISKKRIRLINVGLFTVLAFFIFLYAIADITTSVQTYHLDDPDRSLSKIALILINVVSLVGCISYFFQNKPNFKDFVKSNFLIIVSIFGFCLCCLGSFILNERDVRSLFTTLIYFTSFLTLSSYFSFVVKDELFKDYTFKLFGLTLFYLYIFLCVFYFFYVLGKPMSSGRLRIPVISHVFFCCSLVPFLRQFCKPNDMLVVYFSFVPIMFLANKSSVLIITMMYIFYDLYHSKFVSSRKRLFDIFIPATIIILVLLIVISNVWKGSFFYSHFSFEVMVLRSGRLQNWSTILNSMSSFKFENYLFGKGIAATLKVNDGVAAHNDLIEYLYDFGLLGVLFLLCFVIHFILKTMRYKDKVKKQNSFLLLMYVLIIMSISSFFSNNNLLLSLSFEQHNSIYQERKLFTNETTIYRTISI